ncbi:MAG TPA: hypothetical protein VL049_10830 [Candidatus Dormibacteraeota bacterium]|nr:hypothetical protein [Candidatus Dormibacteraeota bacterium]
MNQRLPMPVLDRSLAHRLAYDDFHIESVDGAGGGVMGAKRLGIVFPRDRLRIDVKWKAAPPGGDGWNNSPRREVGAYVAQQLFLDEDDYLVPPVVARAIGLDAYRAVDEKAAPNIDGTRCVLGAAALWLTDGKPPEEAFDRQRFDADPRYAYHFANLNLLAYLISHRDARKNNFLSLDDANDPRVFLIDNGIAFSGLVFNFFTTNFDKIRVPGLPRQSIDRLRGVGARELQRLAVLGELEVDDEGVLRPVEAVAPLDPDIGNRVLPGRIQLGLTATEIATMRERLAQLLERVDGGELPLF